MGFFDLKAICGICENEVGLNRYKVKKSDIWICPECLKKAGGMATVNVAKVTAEQIKEMIAEIENKDRVKSEIKRNSPLSTAEGMYEYCLENKFGSGWNEKWGVKHFKILEDNLMEGECVKMAFIGLHNYEAANKHDSNYAYAITNKRIIMGQKQTITGEKFQTVFLTRINDITFESGVLLGVVTVDTAREVFNIGLDKGSAKLINSKIHEVLEEVREMTTVSNVKGENKATGSIADEIRKYKELLDMGALTEEEFNKKKLELLK